MKHQRAANAATVLILTALACSLKIANGQEDSAQAIAEHVSIDRASAPNDNFESYILRFDLKLTNRSTKPMTFPTLGVDNGSNEIGVQGVQVRLADGSWANIMMWDWVEPDPATSKYNSCASAPPGVTTEFKGRTSQFNLLKERWANLGRELTIRLYLDLICSDSGRKVFKNATTEPFSIRLPDSIR